MVTAWAIVFKLRGTSREAGHICARGTRSTTGSIAAARAVPMVSGSDKAFDTANEVSSFLHNIALAITPFASAVLGDVDTVA